MDARKIALMEEAERRGILPPRKAQLLAEARKRGLVGGSASKAPSNAAQAPSSAQQTPAGVQQVAAAPAPAEDEGSWLDYVPGVSTAMDVYDLATQGLDPAGNVPESVAKRHQRFGEGTSAVAEAASVMAGGAAGAAKMGSGIFSRLVGSSLGSGAGSAAAQEAQTGEVDPAKTATEAALGAVGQGIGDAVSGGANLFGKVTGRIFGGEGISEAAEAGGRNKYKEMVKALEDEGVPLTEGQKTGSEPLKTLDETVSGTLFGGKVRETFDEQAKAAQSKLMAKAGFDEKDVADGIVDDDTIQRAKDRFRERYTETLKDKEIDLERDSTIDRLEEIQRQHAGLFKFEQKGKLTEILDDFIDEGVSKRLTGEDYQRLRSTLGKQAKNNTMTAPATAQLYKDLQGVLDDAFLEAADASTAKAVRDINKDYRNFTIFKKVAKQGGQGVSAGQLPFASIARAAHEGGTRDFKKLARAASGVFKSGTANSGTATRVLGLTEGSIGQGMRMGIMAGQKLGLGRGAPAKAGIVGTGLAPRAAATALAEGEDRQAPRRILSDKLIRDEYGNVIRVDL